MRPSFSRVLRAVPGTAAVSGSIFASVWLLAINPGHAQVPRAAAGTSSTVVHASLPRTHGTAEHQALLAKTGARTPSIVTDRARSGPSPARVGTAPKGVLRQVAPSSGANAPGPPVSSASATSTPKPASPASVPPSPPSTSPGGSVSFGVAVAAPAPSARKPSSSTPEGEKRIKRPTQRLAGVRAQTSKPSGTKKAEAGQSDKQAAAKQTDGKQTDGKQADAGQPDTKQVETKQAESKQADSGKDQGGQNDSAQSDARKGTGKNKH